MRDTFTTFHVASAVLGTPVRHSLGEGGSAFNIGANPLNLWSQNRVSDEHLSRLGSGERNVFRLVGTQVA
jgi:hypothetical protein